MLHGPVTIAQTEFPVLVLAQNDQTLPGVQKLVGQLAQRDISLITAGVEHAAAINLPTYRDHPGIEPMLANSKFLPFGQPTIPVAWSQSRPTAITCRK